MEAVLPKEKPVVLITGAANNIGRACAAALSSDHTVILADILDTMSLSRELGDCAISVQGDVTNPDDCCRWVAEAEAHGPLKGLVHSAAITKPAVTVEQMSLAEWEMVIRVNLTGTFIVTQATIPALRRAGGGAMVLITSRAGKTGVAALNVNTNATKAHYCASKAGVISLVKSLATELAKDNIRVNGIAPGSIEGTMIPREQWPVVAQKIPLGRLGRAEEIAEAARFLCSSQASYITGHIIDVNGGTLMD
jgi:NAD(P)-dependent dehydrogenase (short-subunit alcohol dehydrogenase family)